MTERTIIKTTITVASTANSLKSKTTEFSPSSAFPPNTARPKVSGCPSPSRKKTMKSQKTFQTAESTRCLGEAFFTCPRNTTNTDSATPIRAILLRRSIKSNPPCVDKALKNSEGMNWRPTTGRIVKKTKIKTAFSTAFIFTFKASHPPESAWSA